MFYLYNCLQIGCLKENSIGFLGFAGGFRSYRQRPVLATRKSFIARFSGHVCSSLLKRYTVVFCSPQIENVNSAKLQLRTRMRTKNMWTALGWVGWELVNSSRVWRVYKCTRTVIVEISSYFVIFLSTILDYTLWETRLRKRRPDSVDCEGKWTVVSS